jgi:hypothetical protein
LLLSFLSLLSILLHCFKMLAMAVAGDTQVPPWALKKCDEKVGSKWSWVRSWLKQF